MSRAVRWLGRLVIARIRQGDPRLADRLQARLRIAIQASAEQGVGPPEASQPEGVSSRIFRQNRGDRVRDCLAGEGALTRDHFEEDGAKGPDVSPPIDRASARLFRRHVGGRSENHPGGRRAIRDRRRRRGIVGAARTSPPSAFARPKSSTLTSPPGVTFTLAGFRSRWMTPRSCAASSAPAIWRRRRRAPRRRERPAGQSILERGAVHQLQHEGQASVAGSSSTP